MAAPLLCFAVVAAAAFAGASGQELTADYYDEACPQALSAIKLVVGAAIVKEPRMGASLVRLHFHDCFVNGCDGSILLDDTEGMVGEKTSKANNMSVRGFGVIDAIKTAVNTACLGNVVSCADILAVAARDSIVARCPPAGDDEALASLDDTPTTVDTDYYQGITQGRALLHTDQQLYLGDGGDSDALVQYYAESPDKFWADFGAAMLKLGGLSPLTGQDGEVREDCRVVNQG
ncbi:Cationic peroxidase 1 [Triticum urartu]|uniref:Cationic peroxidase 1 n=1 Tax=Triticum urartu TaxID=4572 RepID=M7Z0R9_TRIUA|nr:Cationic peroxidase 1 [Triticum urartu]